VGSALEFQPSSLLPLPLTLSTFSLLSYSAEQFISVLPARFFKKGRMVIASRGRDQMKSAWIRIVFAVFMFFYVLGAFQSLDQISAQDLQVSLIQAASTAFPSLAANGND